MTRGWRFRSEMNELGTFAMRQYLETLSPDYFRDWLRGLGGTRLVDTASEAARRVLGELVCRVDAPQWLYEQWCAGRIANDDLGCVIPHARTRHDWPESAIGATA